LKIRNIVKEISIRKLLSIAPYRTLRSYVKKFTSDWHLQYIVDRYATYSGSDPRKAPAPLLTIPFIESAFGAWHISGGLGQLSIKLAERATELGVEIHLNTQVSQILIENGTAIGIKLVSGVEIKSDVVVANADAKLVYEKLISRSVKAAKRERSKLAKRSASFSGFSLFLALDNSKIMGERPKLAHHNIWFPANYDLEFQSLFEDKKPIEDPTIYICAPGDRSLVPNENCESWSVLINAPLHDPKNGVDWNLIEKEYASKIIDKLDQIGLRVSERLVFSEIRSPAKLEQEVMAPGGSIYGTSSNGLGAAFMRAKNRSDVNGLYLVGGSTHPGGGLPLVGISSEIVSEAIG
jgi:phytoene desaturase